MLASIGKFVAASIRCALLGTVCGAIFGAIAGLPFAPPAGPVLGLLFGAVAGFIAGLIGGSFGGSPGFRVGGLVGAIVGVGMFPEVIIFWFAPPLIAVVVALAFGGYVDKQVESKAQGSFLGELVKRSITDVAGYPSRTRTACGFSVASAITIGGFITGWELAKRGWYI